MSPSREASPSPAAGQVRISEEPGILRISWRWRYLRLVFGYLPLWLPLGLLFSLLVQTVVSHPPVDSKALQWLLMLLLWGGWAGLPYALLVHSVNRTVVEARGDHLRIRNGPLPWGREVVLANAEVEYLSIRNKKHFLRDLRGNGTVLTVVTYVVIAHLRGGRRQLVARGLTELQQAHALCEALERRLGLKSAPHTGLRTTAPTSAPG